MLKDIICKAWLKELFKRDNNNTIIESYNNLYNTNLKNNKDSLQVVVNDERFIDYLTTSESDVALMDLDLKEWFS